MQSTRIVTSFLKNQEKILILKRSKHVSMQGLWGGVSGIIEGNEEPLSRARIEIFEETGIEQEMITLLKNSKEIQIKSIHYPNHQWLVHPFLFSTNESKIRLNWENSEFQWINPNDLLKFQTVPSLDEVLANLL